MGVTMEARNATLADLATILKDQQAAKLDLVVPASAMRSVGGTVRIAGTSVWEQEGDGFVPTKVGDSQIADKLGIPPNYLRKLRESRIDLYDDNVNGWLHGFRTPEGIEPCENDPRYIGPDPRTFLVRLFQGEPGTTGVFRSLLSQKYKPMDSFDVLTASLEGVRQAGTPIQVVGCDLTETRMTVKVVAPEIMVTAKRLLEGYRNPFGGNGVFDHSGGEGRYLREVPQWAQEKYGVDPNGVFAGFVITNGETGGSAFTITPRIMVLTCLNGAMFQKDALRSVHLGGALEEGIIRWSEATMQRSLDLVTSQAQDAVRTFLDADYVEAKIAEIEGKALKVLTHPAETVEVVTKKLNFSAAQTEGVLNHFILGGQSTAGGVMQAVTAYAQTVESPDEAFDLEAAAIPALEAAYAAA